MIKFFFSRLHPDDDNPECSSVSKKQVISIKHLKPMTSQLLGSI